MAKTPVVIESDTWLFVCWTTVSPPNGGTPIGTPPMGTCTTGNGCGESGPAGRFVGGRIGII